MTQEITNALSIELLPEEQAKQYIPTTNPAAYELYLIAKNQLNKGNKEAATIAVESLQNALNLDPDFHLAKANLYMAYYSAWDLLGMTTEQLTEKHRELFTELIVTPDVFEDKSLVIADYLVMYMQNYQAAKKATEHAIKLNPSNTDALSTLVLYQNKDDAIKTVERLLKLAPTNIEVKETASYWLSYAGEFKASEQLMAELGEIAPDSNEYLSAAFINFFINKKSAKRALDFADNFQGKINRDNLFLIARLKLITRDIDGALAMLEESKDNYPFDERLAHNLTEMLKAQSLSIWTDSQRNRLEKLISHLDVELQLIVRAKANLQIGNYHEVIKNKQLREIAKSTLPTLRAGIAIREDFAINFALVDAFLGNTELIELANKRWHHLESFCSSFLAFTGCPSLLYYSGKETDKQVLFERLKFILNGSFPGTWGAEQYLLTDPSYLFLHDVPEFKDFAKQYIEDNFSEKSPLNVL
ncbi:MAG: hypothetical protein P8I03_13885 [Thalassotalea sp.]|nr:hypothetical protein [Thalassotalea sp.]